MRAPYQTLTILYKKENKQISFDFDEIDNHNKDILKEEIDKIDPFNTTPMDALKILFDLKNIANGFFDRAISSMMHMLFSNEPSIKKQKEYIIYFYDQFSNTFSIAEAIAYLDMQRIRNLFI